MNKFDPKTLPYLMAGIQSIQYAHAGYVYGNTFGAIALGAVGVGVSLSVAVASSRINDIAVKRKKSAWVAFWSLLIFSPIIVGVAMFYYLSVPDVWPRVIVAAMWGLASDVPVALSGFITGKGLVADDKQPATSTLRPATRPATKKSKISAAMSRPATCPHCGKTKTQAWSNGHVSKCPQRPGNEYAKVLQRATRE